MTGAQAAPVPQVCDGRAASIAAQRQRRIHFCDTLRGQVYRNARRDRQQQYIGNEQQTLSWWIPTR